MKRGSYSGELSAVASAILWGINYPLVKIVLSWIPEPKFLLFRFSITVIILTLYLVITGENLGIEKEHFIPILVLGVFGVGLYNIVWTYGIHQTTAANAALLISTSPIYTGIYSVVSKEEEISKNRWAGTILAFLGIYLIIRWTPGSNLGFDSGSFKGNLLVLIGALLFALYAILAKPLLEHYSPIKLTTLAMAGGLLVLIPFGIMREAHIILTSIKPSIWYCFAYVVLMGTVIAYVLWYKGIKQTSPVKTVLFHYLVPTVSLVTGMLILGEKVNKGQIVGALLVFVGLVFVKLEQRRSIKILGRFFNRN